MKQAGAHACRPFSFHTFARIDRLALTPDEWFLIDPVGLEASLVLEVKEIRIRVGRYTRRSFVIVASVEVRVSQQDTVAWIQGNIKENIDFLAEFFVTSGDIGVERRQRNVVRRRLFVQEEVVVPQDQLDLVAHERCDELEIHIVDIPATKQVDEAQVLVAQWESVVKTVITTSGRHIVATRRPVVPCPNSWTPSTSWRIKGQFPTKSTCEESCAVIAETWTIITELNAAFEFVQQSAFRCSLQTTADRVVCEISGVVV